MLQIQSAIGIVIIAAIAFVWSSSRSRIPWRTVAWGMILQVVLCLLIIVFPPGIELFRRLGDGITWFLGFANEGAAFLFGDLPLPKGQAVVGFQFALTITSVIVFFSSFMAILYHYGIMQRIVSFTAGLLQRTMRTSPIESINAVGEIFLGQTESPLLVRHYIPHISASELFAMMVGGFATIAGSTMGVYVARGISAADLMIASILAAPAALVLAKIAEPEAPSHAPDEKPASVVDLDPVLHSGNVLDAIARGALDGAKLALNVIVVLIAFKALVAAFDSMMGIGATSLMQWGLPWAPHSIEEMLGVLFLPFAWMCGVPSHEAQTFASLLGTKISLTEFIAYDRLADYVSSGALSERTVRLATIALCGFANVMSIGIQIGGYGMMAPGRRAEVARFGFKAMCIGALANLLTACLVGLFI
jgi:concentrative nucleoside transporter, CNT family